MFANNASGDCRNAIGKKRAQFKRINKKQQQWTKWCAKKCAAARSWSEGCERRSVRCNEIKISTNYTFVARFITTFSVLKYRKKRLEAAMVCVFCCCSAAAQDERNAIRMQETERIAAYEPNKKARVNQRIETKKIRTALTTVAPAQISYKLILNFVIWSHANS